MPLLCLIANALDVNALISTIRSQDVHGYSFLVSNRYEFINFSVVPTKVTGVRSFYYSNSSITIDIAVIQFIVVLQLYFMYCFNTR